MVSIKTYPCESNISVDLRISREEALTLIGLLASAVAKVESTNCEKGLPSYKEISGHGGYKTSVQIIVTEI